jgi:hypothetical protein
VADLDLIGGRYLFVAGEKPRGGGFAVVRKAIDIHSGGIVAVKLIEGPSDAIVRKLYEREVQFLKNTRHDHIVKYVDSGQEENGAPYLVLEWVERTFKDVLETGVATSWREFVEKVLKPLADAIAYLHQQSIEHRDVKPGNILMDPSGSPRLADFGISKLKREHDDTSLTLGNFHSHLYSPPELNNAAPFVRDVYSLGVLFIQGTAAGEDRAKEHFELAGVLEKSEAPPEFHQLIASAIDFDPTKRPKNAIEFVRKLDRAIALQAPRRAKGRLVLGLTNRARTEIVGPDGFPDRADAILAADLQTEVYANFRWDAASASLDKSTIYLLGEEIRYNLKFDNARGNLVVVGANHPEYEELERARNRALKIDSLFTCVTQQSIVAGDGKAAFESLMSVLESHNDQEALGEADDDSVGHHLLAGWQRILLAREAVAVGDTPVLEFDGVKPRGNESVFSLLGEQESDLLGSEWQLVDIMGRPTARGTAVHQTDSTLTLKWQWGRETSARAHGKLHPFLGPNQTAIDRQREALRRVEAGQAARPDLLQLIADPLTARPPREIDSLKWVSELDESKRAAVKAAVGADDCLVVSGPPGTGKTRFIAELVSQTLTRNPSARILIVSQTHVAIDNALERLADSGLSGVVRIGRVDDERVAESARHLLLDVQLEKWANETRAKAERYFDSRAASAGIKREHLRAVMLLEEYASVTRNRSYLESQLPSVELTSDQTSGRVGEMSDPIDMRRKIADEKARESGILDKAQVLLGDDLTLPGSATLSEIEAAAELLLSQSDSAEEMLQLLKLQANWLQRISSDDRLAATFLASTKIIAGTCLGFISHKAVRDLTFDLCIVDEASKATSTELLVPLVRSEKFVLVGDLHQLPPLDEELLRSESILRENELSPEFVKETLFERLAVALPKENRFALTEQYRMIAPIGRLISECFYDGALRSPNTVGVRGYENLGKSVLWIDTGGEKRRREQRDGGAGASFLNRLEAEIVFDRIHALDTAIERKLIEPRADGKPYEMLLIAPYRSQLDEFERRLARLEKRPAHLAIEIESVDAVQGREADFTIFSVTRSNPEGRMGFLGQEYWRRINVALSRSRFGLTIVGDAEFSESKPGGLQRVLKYVRQNPLECEIRGADVSK